MTKNSRNLRVLVVEDELLIRWSIVETLSDAGHAVTAAENGTAAIRALTTSPEQFDVIVLDYQLPDSSDLTLLALIRRLSPRSAVILITAYGTPELFDQARQVGVVDVIEKPFDMHDLPARLTEASSLA